jgi:hypothetical protein
MGVARRSLVDLATDDDDDDAWTGYRPRTKRVCGAALLIVPHPHPALLRQDKFLFADAGYGVTELQLQHTTTHCARIRIADRLQ